MAFHILFIAKIYVPHDYRIINAQDLRTVPFLIAFYNAWCAQD